MIENWLQKTFKFNYFIKIQKLLETGSNLRIFINIAFNVCKTHTTYFDLVYRLKHEQLQIIL